MTVRILARFSTAVLTATLIVALTGRVGVGAQQPPAQGPPGPGQGPAPFLPGETAAQHYKNIQVLKDIPAEQLPLTMQYIAGSLGVQCDFCHVQGQGNQDKDEKPQKDTARKMMKMVAALNDQNFEGRSVLSCASCHHGNTPPVRTPPLSTEMTADQAAAAARARAAGRGQRGGGPPQGPGGQQMAQGPGGAPGGPPQGGPPQGPGGPGAQAGRGAGRGGPAEPPKPTETVDQVVDKYLQALGGRPAVENAKTRVMTGTVTMRDLQTSPLTVQEKSTGQFRVDIATQPNPTVRAFNGTAAWSTGMGPNARDLEGFQLQQAVRLADFGLPLRLKQQYTSLAASRYGDIDGKATIILTGRPYPGVTEQLQFDRETGLLLRRNIATGTGLGPLPEQIDYTDYRDVNGLKVPFNVRYVTWNSVFAEKLADVKINAPVADDLFVKPAVR